MFFRVYECALTLGERTSELSACGNAFLKASESRTSALKGRLLDGCDAERLLRHERGCRVFPLVRKAAHIVRGL